MSPLVDIIEITKDAQRFDACLEEMTDLISIAFASNPLTIPALGVGYEKNPELHNSFNRAQLHAALTGAGCVFGAYINVDSTMHLAGVSIWYEPGKQFLDDDKQRKHWNLFYKEVNPEVRKWWDEVMLPRYDQLSREGLGDGAKKGLLHLQVIGVHPRFQQRGVGKAMVKHMLAQSDARGVASCVETSKEANVLFYTELGYRVMSMATITSSHGDLTMWCLYRDPSYEER